MNVHGFDHAYSHGTGQGYAMQVLSPLAHHVFPFDALSNTIIAISIVTAVTQFLIACSPKLSGGSLAFLVAFAEGGMLGTIFLHMLPEIRFTQKSGMYVIGGFLTFVAVDKVMRVLSSTDSSESHPHSHSHLRSPEKEDNAISTTVGEKHGLKNRGGEIHEVHEVNEIESSSSPSNSPSINLSAWLNILADSLHNVTDGISLALSFSNGPVIGFSAFLIMCCHEIPHQFGDFALLINNGTAKSSARKVQLITAMGTLVGAVIGTSIGALSAAFQEAVSAGTAGVFLYVACVGVLPEILETEGSSVSERACIGLVQLVGILSGASLLLFFD